MMQTVSIEDVRKLVLLSQKLPSVKDSGSSISSTLKIIEHLGYIQIDTISVIERAHHHTLWSRNPGYNNSHIDKLVSEKKVFEYWSHAAAYMPMKDYRYSLFRKNQLATGEQKHWNEADSELMNSVLRRIEKEGPLMSKDFEGPAGKTGEWRDRPAKRALENLFMQGDLMSPYRVNFHKVYDLTERVLPEGIDTRPPDPLDYGRFLLTGYLKANGLGQVAEVSYLRKNVKNLVKEAALQMLSDGELLEVKVNDQKYYLLPESLELLNKPLPRARLKILSPFDNLLIQRKRMEALFGYDYQIECYVPQAKRKFGYFSLPVLWQGRLVARVDCKADRKSSVFHINHLAMESWVKKTDQFIDAFLKELKLFMDFNKSTDTCLHKTSPTSLKEPLQKALNNL